MRAQQKNRQIEAGISPKILVMVYNEAKKECHYYQRGFQGNMICNLFGNNLSVPRQVSLDKSALLLF